MCGIGGFVGNHVDGLAARMNAAQSHRGPNGSGIFEDARQGIALAHVRLAILDLSTAAAQPMKSANGEFILVFNGEIYNFRELRQELQSRGCVFKSTGDTEVLLQGLIEHGSEFIAKLNGMFAFAFWSVNTRELLLARDQLGVKPLYFTSPSTGTLLFASELKALCVHPGVLRRPDMDALQQHLAYCHSSVDRTAIQGVRRLSPGHFLRWTQEKSFSIHQFWKPSFEQPSPFDCQAETTALRRLVLESVNRQLVSDVPVGAFLSGGLDSSFLTCAAAEKHGKDFRCYTVRYSADDNRLDGADPDVPHARFLASTLGLKLNEIEIKPDIEELWPRLIHHLDEPIADPAAIACYLICQLARNDGTSVLLSGQGGDELFGGYPRYQAMQKTAWMRGFPRGIRRSMAVAATFIPSALEGRMGTAMRRVRRVMSSVDLPIERQFLSYCANTPQNEINKILSADFKAQLADRNFDFDCINHMESQGLSGFHRLQERDLAVYLPNHNLTYTDKMGMAVGVEARVPLLDMEIVNRVIGYPEKWLLADGRDKAIFRNAARGIVPESIISRKKAGFGAPYRKWLRYDLNEMWNDVLSDSAVKRRGWFDASALKQARERSQSGHTDLYMLQWTVLTIELWARQFIDRNPSEIN